MIQGRAVGLWVYVETRFLSGYDTLLSIIHDMRLSLVA